MPSIECVFADNTEFSCGDGLSRSDNRPDGSGWNYMFTAVQYLDDDGNPYNDINKARHIYPRASVKGSLHSVQMHLFSDVSEQSKGEHAHQTCDPHRQPTTTNMPPSKTPPHPHMGKTGSPPPARQHRSE